MPSALLKSESGALSALLGVPGEKEYRRLLRATRMAHSRFALFPIESDLTPANRTAFIERFRADLAQQGQCLRVIVLSSENWDLLNLPEMAAPLEQNDVVLVVGLEDTPDIVQASGSVRKRPPLLALLNHQRESLRRLVPTPFLLWCRPYGYDALMTDAPDFFDHFVGAFHFLCETPQVSDPIQRTVTPGIGSTQTNSSLPSPTMVEFYRQKLTQHPEPRVERAVTLVDLADALWQLRHGHITSQLEEARTYALEATRILAPKLSSQQRFFWAKAQNTLGLILTDLPVGDRNECLKKAITYYEAALKIYTLQDFPTQWAATQNNTGNAYQQLTIGQRDQNLHKAMTCYEAALEVYTYEKFPMDWAMTQNNMGVVFSNLTTGDQEKNLQKAILCHASALKVYTHLEFPLDWAGTQHNLGTAYLNLPTINRDQHLPKAIACFEAALQVFTLQEFPRDYGHSHFGLGDAYAKMGETERATKHFRNALEGYVAAGLPVEWEWRAYAEERLREL